MRHAFFADMGGFLLVPPDTPPFPVSGKQMHWLVVHNYLPFPDTTSADLADKSKQDTIAKMVACFQSSYLILQCLGRAAQRLTITTLELSALAIVVCSIMTSLCWWYKPADVRTPVRLQLQVSITEILLKAGDAASRPFRQTPLDFIDDLGPSWSLNVHPFMGIHAQPFQRPIPRLGNDRLPNLKGYQEIFLCIATLTYASLHLVGWDFAFPTKPERVLWRTCSMFLFGNTVAFWVFETGAAWSRVGRWQRLLRRVFRISKPLDFEGSRFDREAAATLPKTLPLKAEFWSIFPLAVTYTVARLYLIVEVFVGLRTVDASVYETVNWANFIPHI